MFLGIFIKVIKILATFLSTFSIVFILFIVVLSLFFILFYFIKNNDLERNKLTHTHIYNNFKSLILTIVILSIVGIVNVLGIIYNTRWDFTENRIHTLSFQSQAVVKELDRPLKILIFDRQIDPSLKTLLEKYRRANNQFQFKLVNPKQKLELARQYGVQSLGEIYLQYGNKKQKLNTSSQRNEITTETQLTNSIEQIKQDRSTHIYLLQGHGEASSRSVERGIAQIISRLEKKGNIVSELNLASTGTIPDNADLIIIAGAFRKLLSAEVASLRTYLSTGGNLLLLLSPNVDIGITPLLQEWGVELDNRLVVDGSRSGKIMGFGPGVTIVNDYGNHPITASFGNGISIFPESRTFKIIDKPEVETTPLAITSKNTWAESDLKNEEITFDSTKDLSGPLNIAIALTRKQPINSRMIIFGSSTFATDGWFEQQLNSDLLINSIDWLIDMKRSLLAIQPRESANRRINLSFAQIRLINWLALPILPTLPSIVAILIWYKRR